MPTTSFIIAAYNAERFFEETLNRCLAQTQLPDKILNADDGSTDRTRSKIESFKHKHPDRVVTVLSDKNEGKAIAINRLIDKVGTDYTLIIDADDIAFPTRIERQLWFMEEHKDVNISCSCVKHINEQGRIIGKGVVEILTASDFFARLNANEAIGLYCPATIIRTSMFADSTLRFRQAFWPAEDIDLWNRAAEKGNLIIAQPEFLTGYRIHGGSAVTSSFKTARLKYEFVRACLMQRRHGESEPTWDCFLLKWNSRPWYVKVNTWRKTEAKRRYRAVASCLAGSKYCQAVASFSLAIILQPTYALGRALKQIHSKEHEKNHAV